MESFKDLKEFLQKAREMDDKKQIANLTYKLGDKYLEKGKLELAQPLLEESLSLCKNQENPTAEAIVAFSLASLYLKNQEIDQAEKTARPAYDLYHKDNDEKGLAKICLLLGDIQWAKGSFEQAATYFQKAKEICKTGGDTIGSATLLDRIAKMHRLLDNDEQAMIHFHESLNCWQELGVPDREGMTLTNLGDLYRKRGDLSRAVSCHEQALSIYLGLKNIKAISALEQELKKLKGQMSDSENTSE